MWHNTESKKPGPQEMAEWLKAHTVLAEDPRLVLSTLVWRLTAAYNSSSRKSHASSDLCWCLHSYTLIPIQTYMHTIHIILKKRVEQVWPWEPERHRIEPMFHVHFQRSPISYLTPLNLYDLPLLHKNRLTITFNFCFASKIKILEVGGLVAGVRVLSCLLQLLC